MDVMLLKASLVLALALGVARSLRRAPAVMRHLLWTVAFAALLALPLLAATLPGFAVPMPAGWWAAVDAVPGRTFDQAVGPTSHRKAATAADPEVAGTAHPTGTPTTASLAAGDGGPGLQGRPQAGLARLASEALRTGYTLFRRGFPASLVLALWMLGAIVAAGALLLSLVRVRRLVRTADDVGDDAWQDAAAALGARLGLRRRARLLVSARVGTPMAGGLWRPTVFLPDAARTWSAEQRDIVLAHEIAHLAGGDPLRHVVARLAVAAYWFHPLAWMAARQAAISREQACDEAVLAIGTRPSAYARVLLDIAESMPRPLRAVGALPMVEQPLLERRLMTILNADRRPSLRRWGLAPAIAGAVLTLSIAVAHPAVPAASPAPAAAQLSAGGDLSLTVPATAVVERSAASILASDSVDLQAAVERDSACWWDPSGGAGFSGNISMSDAGGRTVIYEQVGTRGRDRVIQKTFDDLRLCMVAEDVGDRVDADRPSQWPGRARRVVLEARRGALVQRLELVRQPAGAPSASWRVGGAERSLDASAEQWRVRMFAVLDTTWELSTLRGQVSSLHGEISSIRGQESSLRGEISSLRGQVSSMQGRVSSIRGQESSLRGEISSIQGHVSSLRGSISSEQGAISSINGSRYSASDAERAGMAARIQQHDAAIARLEREIRDYDAETRIAAVQRQIQGLSGSIAAAEAEIPAFDLDGKVAAVNRRIADLDVAGKVAAIEGRIEALDADRRSRALETRQTSELKQLQAAIAAIR